MFVAETVERAEPNYSVDLPDNPESVAKFGKRLFDVVAAGVILLVIFPLLMVLAASVARDRGPVFYGHARIGRHGRIFKCLKFRTMRPDADRALARLLESDPAARLEWLARRKLRNDPRVTRLGRFLRTSSLDELPQLLNVLRGDMSLVGPRPVVLEELQAHYDEVSAASYLSVRPGLTGPWQVSGRSDMDYGERVRLDREYARTLSISGDLRLLARTLLVVARRTGAY